MAFRRVTRRIGPARHLCFLLIISLCLIFMAVSVFVRFNSGPRKPQPPPLCESGHNPMTQNRSQLPVILEWTNFFGRPYILARSANCNFKCEITRDRSRFRDAGAIVFHPGDMWWNDIPKCRLLGQRYVYFSQESPLSGNTLISYKDSVDEIPGFFNWTMTYRLDSDVTARYFVPFVDQKNQYFLTKPDLDRILAQKTGNVLWIVSNCNALSNRQAYYQELVKHINITVIGHCFGGRTDCPSPSNGTSEWCIDEIAKYRFFLVFENSICKDYVTEKMNKAVGHVSVPIVLKRKILKPILPKDAFLATDDFSSPKQLADYILNLESNRTEYEKLLSWRLTESTDYSTSEFSVPDSVSACDLCRKLHKENTETKVYESLHNWIRASGICDEALTVISE